MKVEVESVGMIYKDIERDVEVLKDINFTINSGTSVAIVGASGVGKTTLLNIIGALEEPTSGRVKIDGKDYKEIGKSKGGVTQFRGKNIGFIFQFHYLLPEFSAVENVAMPLIIQGLEHEKAHARAKSLLSQVGLAKRLEHRPTMLSGGEQQLSLIHI